MPRAIKRRDLLKGLPAGAALLAAGGLPANAGNAAVEAENRKITVLNPAVTGKPAERTPLTAPRLNTLEGKTIYIVDVNYEGMSGTPVMEEMQRRFSRDASGVKAVYRLKEGNYLSDDPALWREIAASGGDGAVIGVGG